MQTVVVGGRLQGLEAAYLAKKAGWQVKLIDKSKNLPALNLADSFTCLNAEDQSELIPALKGADLIIPALENRRALQTLVDCANKLGIPCAFDLSAYDISSSKKKSDLLFAELGVPAPPHYPGCRYPLIAKPSGSSGSEGVVHLKDEVELEAFKKSINHETGSWVIQEYISGPSYSIEVIGCRGRYLPLQVTDLEMDGGYDCKRVTAPSVLTASQRDQFAEIAVQIARSINLNGIMDVEVILNNNQLFVLEIDARLPSQTPTAVYHSSGINLLELTGLSFAGGNLPEQMEIKKERFAIFEHLLVSSGRVEVSGEHIVSNAGPLTYFEGFFGADEALTNYRHGKENWMATLIITGETRQEAYQKRSGVIEKICSEAGAACCHDPVPPPWHGATPEG
jgi:pyrrolysine biosynthesis protein PylC